MATRPFDKDKPLHWRLSGGRHNALSRHRGMGGLWYLIGTWGQGRSHDGWSIAVFPDSVRISGYAGDNYSRIMTEALQAHCLLELSGHGGHDFGKGFMSKGGYRSPFDIPYVYSGKEFDPKLLSDGDEFLQQVLGFEPTVKGIKDGLARQAQEAADKKAAEEARVKAWHEEYQAREKAASEAKESFHLLFEGVEIPQEFHSDIRSDGLHVWRDRGEEQFQFRYYDQATLNSLEVFQQWLTETKEKLEKGRVEHEKNERERVCREAKQKAQEDQIAQQKKAIENDLNSLDNLLSKL